MLSEITEETEKDQPNWFINTQVQEDKIRRIIQHQKSLYSSSSSSLSSSSSSSLAASCSSSSSSPRRNLLELMKAGSTSLRRLFDMEHTSLAAHFEYYSGSPLVKPIPLWGTDSELEHEDPWAMINMQIGRAQFHESDRESGLASKGSDFGNGFKTGKRTLTRKKSFRRLPRLGIWTSGRFRFRVSFRRRFKLWIYYCKKLIRRQLQLCF